jgi:hypothetical protein
MFNQNHYVPVVRWKRGEQKALELLENSLKNFITPLIEIPPIPWDFEKELPKKLIDEHLNGIGMQVKKAWNYESPVFIDAFQVCIEDDESMEGGQHPIEFIVEQINLEGGKAIPVVNNRYGANYHRAVKNVVDRYDMGFCLRIKDDELDDIIEIINWVKKYFNPKLKDIDLFIDCEYIDPKYESRMARLISGSITLIPNLSEWRTFTICGTSFPDNLGEIPTGTDGSFRRSEWHIYKKILDANFERYPSFADYIISNPSYTEIDPRVMQMAANVRYTAEDDFLIFRGYSIRSPKHNGWGQTANITKRIVAHSQYSGKTFSYGDEYIYNCSINKESSGNAETWRRVGTNHHLTLIINELSKIHDEPTAHLS